MNKRAIDKVSMFVFLRIDHFLFRITACRQKGYFLFCLHHLSIAQSFHFQPNKVTLVETDIAIIGEADKNGYERIALDEESVWSRYTWVSN